MTNREKYNQVFVECFMLEAGTLSDEFAYQSVPEWDSVGHMGLIAGLEEAFDIMMETDDIIDLSSYKMGTDILAKYKVLI